MVYSQLGKEVGAVVLLTALTLWGLAVEAGAYRRPGRTFRVSVASDGSQSRPIVPGGDVTSWHPSLSKDGRFIAFSSEATNFIPNKLGVGPGIYVHDRKTGRTEAVSKTSTGEVLSGSSPSISADGRYVAFTADTLDRGDVNGVNDIYVYDRRREAVQRVSVSNDERLANGASTTPSLSPNGRYVAFGSRATNLVSDVGPQPPGVPIIGQWQIFLRDLKKKTTVRISVPLEGGHPDGENSWPSVSNDRIVVFTSTATNLVERDLGGRDSDVFVRDVTRRRTIMVSSPASSADELVRPGVGTAIPFGGRSITADGRLVAFTSNDANLVPEDRNGGAAIPASDIFVYDRKTERTERVSVTSIGHESNGSSRDATISLDGRYVSFSAFADNLSNNESEVRNPQIPHDGDPDFFLYDRITGAVEWISLTPSGKEAESCFFYDSALGGSGRFVAFSSCAGNIVSGDTNDSPDVFVRDRGSPVGGGPLVSGGRLWTAGSPNFHRKGYVRLSDPDDDSLAPAPAGAELIGATVAQRPDDLFVRIDVESLTPSRLDRLGRTGDPNLIYGLRFELDDLSYELRAHRSVAGDRFTLFRCSRSCVEAGPAAGAFGTTGHSVVAAIPLNMLSRWHRGAVKNLHVFVATGGDAAGGLLQLDEARLL